MKILKKKKKNSQKQAENTEKTKEENEPFEEELTLTEISYNDEGDEISPSEPSVWDLIAPDGISIDSQDSGVIKQSLGTKTHFRPFYIPLDGYPRKMSTNWLYKMISAGEVDIY